MGKVSPYHLFVKKLNLVSVLLFILVAPATQVIHAFVFDWTGRTFNIPTDPSPGTISQTYTNVDGSGIDFTVTLTVQGTVSYISSGGDTYPIVSSAFEIDDALDIWIDAGNRTSSILITVSFSAPINNLNLQVFDLDTNNDSDNPNGYRDQVRNPVATAPDSSTFGATLTTNGTHTIANNGSTTASATSIIATGNLSDDDNDGTVNISFGTGFASSVSIEYGNPNNGTVLADPSSQAIGFGNIAFTVPEPSTYAAAVILSVLGMGHLIRRHQRKVRSQGSSTMH